MNKEEIEVAARSLLRAARHREPIEPLTQTYPKITIEDAYEIQLCTVNIRVAGGRRVIGKKIGLTSPAMQQMLGVAEPDYGHLLDDMLIYQGAAVPSHFLIQPRIEGEIAFVLDRDILGPGVTPHDVVRATAGVAPALEIIDSRIKEWRISIQDTVADNASSAFFLLGTNLVPIAGLDLRFAGFVLEKNGQVVVTAAGAAVLGSPVQAVAWLANKMGEYGIALKAGEIILSGSAGTAVPVGPGDCISLTVDRVGSVSCFFA
jgi:2-keto-4-pentenoate hydratase